MKKQLSSERHFTLSKKAFHPLSYGFFLGLFLFPFIGINQNVMAQNSASETFLKAKELKLERKKVMEFFSLKKGDKTSISNSGKGEKSKQELLSVNILNHSSVGEKSGVIAATIALDKQEARLLMNRKERNGKIVYWIAILIPGSNEAFKLKEESKEEFILERTTKDQVVTE